MSLSHDARRKRWREIVDGQPGSGLSVVAYCRRAGVAKSKFYVWRQRFAPEDQGRRGLPESGPGFVEVIGSGVDARAGAGAGIEICLASGHRLLPRRGFDRELLLELIGVLGGSV